MKTFEDGELSRQFQTLAAEIPVPAASLRRKDPGVGWTPILAGGALVAVVILVLAVVVQGLRSGDASVGASPTPAVSASPARNAELAFPDLTLLAGTADGFVYRSVSSSAAAIRADACQSQTVLGLQPSPSGQMVLVVCGGRTEGTLVVLDSTTLARRAGPLPSVPRDDVAAWSPDESAIAFLQTGRCDPLQPVCSVHLALWNLSDSSTRIIRPDEPLTMNVRWSALGLSVSFPQGPQPGTLLWDGQAWHAYSTHRLWVANASRRALLVEAGAGSIGGRVWQRDGDQERLLTQGLTDTEYPLALLDNGRAAVWRDEARAPGGSVVIYNDSTIEHLVPVQGFCGSAQRVGRWLVCTKSGSNALAYSLDDNQFARRQITGLPNFNALTALPKT
ncbi:MAG: hypothetical protein M3T56_03255 [Chloroflexota bacterium]|nr:hypothetical protein [Chloroflexota bacterium]